MYANIKLKAFFCELSSMNTTTPIIKWGWLRALIYFITIAAIGFGTQLLNEPISQIIKNNTPKAFADFYTFFATYTFSGILFVLITFLFTKFIDRQQVISIGFAIKDYKNEGGIGVFTAMMLLGTGTIILIVTGHLSVGGFSLDPWMFLMQLMLMLIVGFVEEIMFRGYILNNLMQSMNRWIALIISAALFAVVHLANPDMTIFSIVNILLAGMLLGLNYVYTKNLWYSIAFHFCWNFIQGPVLGYEVSGYKLQSVFMLTFKGSKIITGEPFGFEGSSVCAILLLISLIVFYKIFSKRYEFEKQP